MNINLATLRYLIALSVLLLAPPSLLIWLIIHPLARLWRRIGLYASYFCLMSLMILLGWAIWRMKGWLLRIEYGTQFALIVLSVICICISALISSKREKQLTFMAVIGLPELSNPNRSRALITRGVYAWVRNPRYLETALFYLGCAFFANYLAVYALWLVGLPILHLVVLLEERELYQTFGDEFLAYCTQVPRYIPKRL